ncbi:PAS domain S-box protein [Rhodocytophaga rosea]|uniref:PAS domain S-box protein n=1 Tax=Rhodocytophaga rosea TaxID=2704465 RepID=A0A6C0GL41_9BACT|nr:PAS domain-containing protein [Rhodocytophaga rosea]QHT68801.1 PAS domain S-box protein [Rhodocytophaga rosea]
MANIKSQLLNLWQTALRIGFNPAMDYTQQMKLFALNAFLFMGIILTLFFVIVFTMLGSYSALQGLAILPILSLVFYLNSKAQYTLARIVVIYGLLFLILMLAIADRRTGTEYILIAIGCCSVSVFDRPFSVLFAFLSAFGCYSVYIWFDATHSFVADPSVPYIFVQNALMFLSGFAVMAQSFALRSLIDTYSKSLSLANEEVKSVNEKLKTSNEELLTFSEQLDVRVKQQSAELQAYLDAININLLSATTDWTGHIIRVNDPLTEATSFSSQELINRNFQLFTIEDHHETSFEHILHIVHTGQSWRGEVKIKTKAESFLWVDMVVIPVKAQPEVQPYLLLLALSISERKQLEEQNLKAISALESVAFRTSHEVRGPLARIIGLTDLLNKDAIEFAEINYVSQQLIASCKQLDLATRDLTIFVNEYQGNTASNDSDTKK